MFINLNLVTPVVSDNAKILILKQITTLHNFIDY